MPKHTCCFIVLWNIRLFWLSRNNTVYSSRPTPRRKQQQGVVESSDQHNQELDSSTDALTVSPDKKRKRDEVVKYLNGEEWAMSDDAAYSCQSIIPSSRRRVCSRQCRIRTTFLCLGGRGSQEGTWSTRKPFKRYGSIRVFDVSYDHERLNLIQARRSFTENDIQGGLSKFNPPVKELLYKLYESNPTKFFKTDKRNEPKKNPTLIVAPPVLDQAESVL